MIQHKEAQWIFNRRIVYHLQMNIFIWNLVCVYFLATDDVVSMLLLFSNRLSFSHSSGQLLLSLSLFGLASLPHCGETLTNRIDLQTNVGPLLFFGTAIFSFRFCIRQIFALSRRSVRSWIKSADRGKTRSVFVLSCFILFLCCNFDNR